MNTTFMPPPYSFMSSPVFGGSKKHGWFTYWLNYEDNLKMKMISTVKKTLKLKMKESPKA